MDDSLVKEIQRIVFNSHPENDRLGAETFDELLRRRLQSATEERQRQEQILQRVSQELLQEQTRKESLAALQRERAERVKAVNADTDDRKLLVPKGQEERTKRFEEVTAATEVKQSQVTTAKLRLQALNGLLADANDFIDRRATDWLAEVTEERLAANLSEADWKAFRVQFVEDVSALLATRIVEAKADVNKLEGAAAIDPVTAPNSDIAVPLIADDAKLVDQTLSLLNRECQRLQALFGIDAQNARRYKMLSDRIAKEQAALQRIVADISRAEKSDEAIKSLRLKRRLAYEGVFKAVVDEEAELAALYAPLKERIAAGHGSLSKLSFSVRRLVDMVAWAKKGESLLDLRAAGAFRGEGQLLPIAERMLGEAWRQGGAAEVSTAMTEFIQSHADDLRKHRPDKRDIRSWSNDISSWLYSTKHIRVGYRLQYEGTNIEQLSPGTRGIVLLLLYLALDGEDDRPLIIDQPEENLDPQSVFDELVGQFREAKKRRQVIIVTHNANLVINTDVDQVIVACCGPQIRGRLPDISYQSGGLENPNIRRAVCAILEGGERAFRERARRLRLSVL